MPNSKISRTTPETQARKRWTPPHGVLGDLIERAVRRAELLANSRDDVESSARATTPPPSLATALSAGHVAVIAEVKRASPSRGAINPNLSVDRQVQAYQRGGASAVSVLTEPELFGGAPADLRRARESVTLPILRKDFHVREIQLFEARAMGASAALIIARALEPARLCDMIRAAKEAGVEALVEVRDDDELADAIRAGATLIGVNNRNLESLEVDPDTVTRVVPHIPADCIAIAESGYGSRDSIEEAARAGADAVLIGSFLSASTDPAASLRDLISVQRRGRHEAGGKR